MNQMKLFSKTGRIGPLRIITIILGALLALILLLFGVGNLIDPEVTESYLDQNTRVCVMMIITGVGAVYSLFRPFTGGVLLCICAVGLSFVFGGFLHNPITPVVLLFGGFSILTGYLTRQKLR
jgi:hypothetical protein